MMGKSYLLGVSALALLGITAGAFASPNLVQNGGFESTTLDTSQFNFFGPTGVDDWAGYGYGFFSSPQTLYAYWSPESSPASANGFTLSPNGGNFIGEDGDPTYYVGPVEQMITGLTAGKKYDLGFYWAAAQEAGYGVPGMGIEDQWSASLGSETQTTAYAQAPYAGFSGWMHQDFIFTATGPDELLSFLANGGPPNEPPFALLDGVTLNAIPEPAEWVMMLIGFGALGVVARLRRRVAKAPSATSA